MGSRLSTTSPRASDIYRRALIERGIYPFPLPCKRASISAAHTEADIDRTLEITEDALASL